MCNVHITSLHRVSQDNYLAEKVKKKAGVPLLFIIQNTMVLDKPSPKSVVQVKAAQTSQLIPEHQKHSIQHLKEEQGVAQDSERRRRKRRRVGGPNPLSCLKKKKKQIQAKPTTAAPEQKKKKRNRKKRRPPANITPLTA
ncbi:hypothetical protein GDO81_028270 [Engystomops pustulosus]|uniref:UTP23 sensor motif region domain-containing protein n=1 Tax=Engystomops pustulosus TaxID=76066 RepID=A0AAV6YJV7_ENGPU|nr:hypothetical protein GDO81_028270 [Engystomops pustulosus]